MSGKAPVQWAFEVERRKVAGMLDEFDMSERSHFQRFDPFRVESGGKSLWCKQFDIDGRGHVSQKIREYFPKYRCEFEAMPGQGNPKNAI